jgi:hypothetical protein
MHVCVMLCPQLDECISTRFLQRSRCLSNLAPVALTAHALLDVAMPRHCTPNFC